MIETDIENESSIEAVDYGQMFQTGGNTSAKQCKCLKCKMCKSKMGNIFKNINALILKYYQYFLQKKQITPPTKSPTKSKKSPTKSPTKSQKSPAKSQKSPTKSPTKSKKSLTKSKKIKGGIFGFGQSSCNNKKTIDFSSQYEQNIFNTGYLGNSGARKEQSDYSFEGNLTTSFI